MVVAPRLQARFGTVPTLLVNLLCMSAVLAAMAIGTDHKAVLAACVVVAGLFIGVNNTLITETVMKAAPAGRSAATRGLEPVERGVASAAYSFVRFGGAALAPWLAGFLGERFGAHLPFWVGAAAVLAAVGVLGLTSRHLTGIDIEEDELEQITERATAVLQSAGWTDIEVRRRVKTVGPWEVVTP